MSTVIRSPEAEDVARLEAIENAADARLTDLFRAEAWAPAEPGRARARRPGFILIAAEEPGGEALGFVHVLESGDLAHLEQLSVLPAVGRRGHGRALVDAALTGAAARGHDRITLRTYADVPWNAPFYASCGFDESQPDTPFLLGLVQIEQRLGLDQYGKRIQMSARLS